MNLELLFLPTVFDASAKLPTGLTDGKLHWLGSYEMCNDITVDYTYYNSSYGITGEPVENRTFKGQYCRLDLTVSYYCCSVEGHGSGDPIFTNVQGLSKSINFNKL